MNPVWQPDVPYDDLPAPPSAGQVETPAVLKAAIAANVAVARLDQAARSLPDPSVLINTIPLLEAQASSEIENIVTTTDELFRHLDNDAGADAATKETLRYRTALHRGFELTQSRGLSTTTIITVCSTIKGHEMALRDVSGTRVGNPISGRVVYSPPEGRALIADKLGEWERFVHAGDGMDQLVRMAVAHYQFEAIHPFPDGNGRTGRILNVLMLVRAGLLHLPLLYLSHYFIDTRSEYYRLLLAVTSDGAWEEWIRYVLAGVERTSSETVRRIMAIRALQDDFARRARTVDPGAADYRLLSVLFEQPYSRISTVINQCDISRPTATKRLSALVDAGLLTDLRSGRDRYFINREFLELLTRPV